MNPFCCRVQHERVHTEIAHIHLLGTTEESEDQHSAALHQLTGNLAEPVFTNLLVALCVYFAGRKEWLTDILKVKKPAKIE